MNTFTDNNFELCNICVIFKVWELHKFQNLNKQVRKVFHNTQVGCM